MSRINGRVIAIIISVILVLALVGVGLWLFLKPDPIQGDPDRYKVVTLRISEDLYYDVHVPTEAQVIGTDHQTVYEFDLLTIGVQDVEPPSNYKVKIGNRWVFATSNDYWYAAVQAGFETEQPYQGWINTYEEDTRWDAPLPTPSTGVSPTNLEKIREDDTLLFGGEEFISVSTAYGTQKMATERLLRDMSVLFGARIYSVSSGSNYMYCEVGSATVACVAVNYNTYRNIVAYGQEGRDLALALIREVL